MNNIFFNPQHFKYLQLHAELCALHNSLFTRFRLLLVTVRHAYLGRRVFQVPWSTAVQQIKQLIYQETDFPVCEQQLIHNGKVVSNNQ